MKVSYIYIGDMRSDYYLKLILLGDAQVGKSSLADALAGKDPEVSYIPTIGIDFRSIRQRADNGDIVKLHVWDAAGADGFRSIVETYCACVGGAVVIYDVTRRDTFRAVEGWITLAKESRSAEKNTFFPVVVVGNKLDLSTRRVVTFKEGMEMAESLGAKYMETSARGGINVAGLKDGMIDMMLNVVKKKHENYSEGIPEVSDRQRMSYTLLDDKPPGLWTACMAWVKKLF